MNKDKKAALDTLKKVVKEELYKCIRCSECRTVCPIFKEMPAERYTARGKMQIAQALAEGRLEFTPHAREALDNCLLCTGCASQCGSGARADRVIAAARQAFAEELGLPAVKKAISLALGQGQGLLGAEARMGALLQPLLFKGVPQDSGLYRRFAMPFVDEKQYIPKVAATPLRSRVSFAGEKGWPTVTFFTGCMTNYVMTEIGDSLIKVCNALQIAVRLPSAQGCCGMPMLISGDREAVRKAARRNVEAQETANPNEPVLVVCPSGGHMLRHGYLELFADDPAMKARLESLSARVMDATEFLIHRVGAERLERLVGRGRTRAVTYHDPCHLRKAQKVTEEPREVLSIAARGEIREMRHPEACCGLGGTYFLTHLDMSKKIQSRKIEDIMDTCADCVATTCPGCIMQLRDGIRRSKDPGVSVKHVIQVLAEAF